MVRWVAAGMAVAVLALAALAVLAVLAPSVMPEAAAQNAVPVRATISGEVLPLQLAAAGQSVKEGDTLLFVRSATGGAVPAARAPINGQVVQMLVRPGDHVNIGDVVATILPR